MILQRAGRAVPQKIADSAPKRLSVQAPLLAGRLHASIVNSPTPGGSVVTVGMCVLATIMVLASCAQRAPGAAPSGPGGDRIVLTGDQKADWAQIVALENGAKA